MDFSYKLLEGFLSGPGPETTKQPIDFQKTELPEYENYYACILDGVLTADECASLIKGAEAHTDGRWQVAMVNVGNGG